MIPKAIQYAIDQAIAGLKAWVVAFVDERIDAREARKMAYVRGKKLSVE